MQQGYGHVSTSYCEVGLVRALVHAVRLSAGCVVAVLLIGTVACRAWAGHLVRLVALRAAERVCEGEAQLVLAHVPLQVVHAAQQLPPVRAVQRVGLANRRVRDAAAAGSRSQLLIEAVKRRAGVQDAPRPACWHAWPCSGRCLSLRARRAPLCLLHRWWLCLCDRELTVSLPL
jgi:hypothetical protein